MIYNLINNSLVSYQQSNLTKPASYNCRKSPLKLLVLSTLGMMSFAHAGDTAECSDANCETVNTIWGARNTFTTPLRADGKRTASLSGNNVTVDTTKNNLGYILGSYSEVSGETDIAENNTLEIINIGKTKNSVRGAYSQDSEAKSNHVILHKGMVEGITGGRSKIKNADGNTVVVHGGKITSVTIGGQSDSGKALNNKVTINGGELDIDIYGGYSKNGVAKKNYIIINYGVIGKATGEPVNFYGGLSYRSNALENTVTINGGTINENVNGGFSFMGDANNNKVVIGDNALINREIHGGHAMYSSGNANNNIVDINGGTLKDYVYGGHSDSGNADGNTITISGGTINTEVKGGYGHGGDATNNTINIKKGENGNPTLISSILWGGKSGNTSKDVFTGNTLNLHTKDINVSDVKNFENYNFYLSNDVDKGSTMLKLTSTNATDLSASNYGVGVKTGTTTLPQGYTVTLIESATTLTLSSPNPANDNTNMTDIVSGYEFRLSVKDGNKLVAELPYTVTIENSDPSKGSVSNESEAAYLNETITFDATPNPGYIVTINSTCGTTGSWDDDTYTSSEITDKCTITVNWEEINHTIFSDSFE